MPVVSFVRACHVAIVVAAFVFHAPWLIALDLAATLLALFGGPNLLALGGRFALKGRLAGAPVEEFELARFNNAIAVVLFALALVAFALGWWLAGWILAAIVALAAAVAILGFCFGCFLYYQFKLNRFRIFGG